MEASVASLASRLGVSRLANVTGLDRIGYPVIAAVRPLSRNLTVSFGKGPTLDAARLSAVMEAAELFCSESPPEPTTMARYCDLSAGTAVDPDLLALEPGTVKDLASRAMPWVTGRIISSGQKLMVPWQVVSMDFSRSTRQHPARLQFGATGLAASWNETSAILHGLYEVVERDSHQRWNERDDRSRFLSLTDHTSSKAGNVQELIGRIERAGLEVMVWDMTGESRVPCFLAEVLDFAEGATTCYAQGVAAHLDWGIALEKAMAEALQVRVTYIAGSRDDLEWSDYGNRYDAVVASRSWVRSLRPRRRTYANRTVFFKNAESELAELLRCLSAGPTIEPIVVPLSGQQDGYATVKVIVPGAKDTPEANYYEDQRRKLRHEKDA